MLGGIFRSRSRFFRLEAAIDEFSIQEGKLKSRDELTRELAALRERIAALSVAVLRISGSLDPGVVLQEAVDAARTLTGARYGIIITLDEAGEVRDFVTSGFTAEERLEFANWEDGPRLYEHFQGLPGTLRVADLPAYVRALGYPADLIRSKTFQGTPMRYRGVHVGNFFLAEKENAPEFTAEDEEVLLLFASQAAAAIANARTYRDEKRARADLEALVETSPVGVVVLDARTGKPVSTNQEANRIIEPLCTPGRPAEDLLNSASFRFADGREGSLKEVPITQAFIHGESIHAEEVEISVPDGRSVSMLVNGALIPAEDGTIASVVVTIQDLAPLEELERQRAEFLGLVSHELRTPLAAIKGSTATVLGATTSLDAAEVEQFFRIIDKQADHMRGLISDLLDVGRIDAGTLSVSTSPVELAEVVDQARNAFLNGGGAHTILIDLPQDLPRVLVDGRRIVQVLNNLFSNAARHSPASAPIRVAAVRDGPYAAISVSDEGRGIPAEQLPYLFRKYGGAVEGAGRRALQDSGGLGLAICKGLVEAHGGRIRAESGGPGQGAQFTFTIPLIEEAGDAAASVVDRPRTSHEGIDRPPILVVDDDPQTLRFVRDALTQAGFSAIVTGDHRELPRIIEKEKPCLVLLDLVFPGTDGIELMENIPRMAELPIIFISAYGRDETIARALEKGAADYLVKPFSATELTARIRAVLRRRAEPEPFVLGELAIHYEQRQVSVAGREVALTAMEFELLRVLSMNAGRVMTYDSLIHQLWKGPDTGDPNRVRTFVKQLRRKLGDDPAHPSYILNVRGAGYRMVGPGEP